MRVTHLIKVVLVAGAERHLLTLLPALREQGVEPSILLLTEPDKPMDDYVEMAAAAGIPLAREVIRGHADPSLIRRIRGRLMVDAPDILHTHLLHADLYGLPAARLAGVRGVVSSRHNDNAFRRRMASRGLHWGLWRLTDAGIAISDALRAFCIEVEGAPPERIRTVRYGVQPGTLAQDVTAARAALRERLGLPADAVIVGAMCRLIEQKGLTYGLRAFARVAEQYPNAHLVIAGTGALRGNLEIEARSLGIPAHFIGWQAQPTVTLAGYDVLLMPSLWEGFGLVMLEAMAQGVPIVGSRVSAIPEVVVHGETGMLAAPADVDGLAAALDALLGDDLKRRTYGEAGRERLRTTFSAGRMARETVEVYRSVLSG